MANKVSPTLPLILLKAIFFFFTFSYVLVRDFSVFSIIVFILISSFLYIKPVFNTFLLRRSFFVLIILSLVTTANFVVLPEAGSNLPLTAVAFAVLFTFLFYVLAGIKNFVFLNRKEWYYFLNLALIYLSFIVFFASDKISGFSFIIKAIVLFFALFLLIKEFLVFNKIAGWLNLRVMTWLLSFLALEAVLIISLIPIGIPNAASLAVLFTFILLEANVRYFKSEITTKFIKANLGIFIVLTIVIFLTF